MTAGLRRATQADRAAIERLQADAYAQTALVIGRTPIPLTWDYGVVIRDRDVRVAEDAEGLTGVLILNLRPHDLYLESIAVASRMQGTGLGNRLLAATDVEARRQGRSVVRLLTNAKNVDRIALYARRGYVLERTEHHDGRQIVHMAKHLDGG